MPAGIVIAALAVIALVAIVALSLFGGSSVGSPTDGIQAEPERMQE
ncbi:MAG: hypothetical protein IMF08_02975 [Proteobacteria bacterium]|nr:hypothetical protein [Pseudomonadota bacterium]MCK4868870.1 hypothetical protein [Alphaproteobacteria bacterium]